MEGLLRLSSGREKEQQPQGNDMEEAAAAGTAVKSTASLLHQTDTATPLEVVFNARKSEH